MTKLLFPEINQEFFKELNGYMTTRPNGILKESWMPAEQREQARYAAITFPLILDTDNGRENADDNEADIIYAASKADLDRFIRIYNEEHDKTPDVIINKQGDLEEKLMKDLLDHDINDNNYSRQAGGETTITFWNREKHKFYHA